MPNWLDYPEQLDSAATAKITAAMLKLMSGHVNARTARNLQILQETIVEWRSQGCYIYDPEGKAYFDAAGAGGVFALGHAHPLVVTAMQKQLARGGLSLHAGLVPQHLELLSSLSRVTPGHMSYGYIGCTGTESMEMALRLARIVTGRPQLIGTRMSYHGMSLATQSISGAPYWKQGLAPLLPDCRIIPYNDIKAAQKAITQNTAAVVIEPIQWASGCILANREYVSALREFCNNTGALLIFDEIQTGLGRTGHWFAADYFQVIPDMISLGKALSAGMIGISALMYSDRVQEAIETHRSSVSSTFSSSPLACSAALAFMQVMHDNNLVSRVNQLGLMLQEMLDGLVSEYADLLTGHSGLGLMRCLGTRSAEIGILLAMWLVQHHQCLVPAMSHAPHLLRLSPAYITTAMQMSQLKEAITYTLEEIRALGANGAAKYLLQATAKLPNH